ncbi:MAG: hypothetical protein ACJ8C6_06475 [Microvirga sp.]
MTDENEFSAAAGKAVDDALAAIETIGKAGDSFRAAVEERFGAEVARREATWFITEVHRELALHLDFIGSTSGGWPEWRKKGELLAWMKPKSRARLRAA